MPHEGKRKRKRKRKRWRERKRETEKLRINEWAYASWSPGSWWGKDGKGEGREKGLQIMKKGFIICLKLKTGIDMVMRGPESIQTDHGFLSVFKPTDVSNMTCGSYAYLCCKAGRYMVFRAFWNHRLSCMSQWSDEEVLKLPVGSRDLESRQGCHHRLWDWVKMLVLWVLAELPTCHPKSLVEPVAYLAVTNLGFIYSAQETMEIQYLMDMRNIHLMSPSPTSVRTRSTPLVHINLRKVKRKRDIWKTEHLPIK